MNNYDKSSSGIDIELFLYHDSYTAQGNWDEAFEVFNEDSDTYIYTPLYEPSSIVEFDDLYEVEEPRLGISLRILLDKFYYEGNIAGFDKDSAWDEMKANMSLEDMDMYKEILDDYGIKYKKLYDEVETRGYSQGDWARVLIPHYLYEDLGIKEDVDLVEYFQQDIDSLFWDNPLVVRLSIDGKTYCSEMFDNLYEVYGEQCWDKDLFINEVIKEFPQYDEKLLRSELDNLVPDEVKEYL